jgi:hypothetical protein
MAVFIFVSGISENLSSIPLGAKGSGAPESNHLSPNKYNVLRSISGFKLCKILSKRYVKTRDRINKFQHSIEKEILEKTVDSTIEKDCYPNILF